MLLDLEDVKLYLGVTVETDDDLLDLLIELSTGDLETYCDRVFQLTEISGEVLTVELPDYDRLPVPPFSLSGIKSEAQLYNYPVISGLTIVNGETEVSEDNYFLFDDLGIVQFFTAVANNRNTLVANYTAGYTSSSLPAGLKSVLLELVASRYREVGKTSKGSGTVKSKRLGEFSVSFGESTSRIDYYSGLLNKFKRAAL